MVSTTQKAFNLELNPDALIPISLLLVLTTFRFGVGHALLATVAFFVCLFAHEAGHALTAIVLQTPVSALGLCMKGAYIKRRKGEGTKELLISAAGPGVNLVIAAALWNSSGLIFWVAQMNLILAIMNLLPFKGSDGSRILACLREMAAQARLIPQVQPKPTSIFTW